jgi:hypothetical protein
MYLTTILIAALISVLIFIGYNRPWATASGAFRLTRSFAVITLFWIGASILIGQQYTLRANLSFPQGGEDVLWPERIETLLKISSATTALSWVFLLLTLRGVFKVLSLWNPDRR